MSAFIQSLESRTLLSSVVLAPDGALSIRGGGDIRIGLSADAASVEVHINGDPPLVFAVDAVKSVAVYGSNGPDRIAVDETNGAYDVEMKIYGGNGRDTIYGGSGNDLIHGGNGRDWIHGGAGNDTLYGGNGRDKLFGGPGDDYLSGGNGRDLLAGGEGNDSLFGGNGNDVLLGGIGDDLLSGGRGRNLLDPGE